MKIKVRSKYFIALITLLGIVTFIFLRPHKKKPKESITQSAFQYRNTMPNKDSQILYPYVFYQQSEVHPIMKNCSAIIKNIDPKLDDYKNYCKSVIGDILKIEGDDNVVITIYDDGEAFDKLEICVQEKFEVLNTNQIDSLEKHVVAVYYGNNPNYDGEFANVLNFFPNEKNELNEKEEVR